MFGGNPVFVSVMYSSRARIRRGSVHVLASCAREAISFSRRSRACWQAGQVRMAF